MNSGPCAVLMLNGEWRGGLGRMFGPRWLLRWWCTGEAGFFMKIVCAEEMEGGERICEVFFHWIRWMV